MKNNSDAPDLNRVRGVIAPEILHAVETASQKLREEGIPHALAGGLAVGAHGYPRTTEEVVFLVGDDAFVKHAGGLVTLRVPLVAVGKVRVDFVSIDETRNEREQMTEALENSPTSGDIPIVPLPVLVYMKIKAGRQKDIADVVELLKRGRIDLDEVDHYFQEHAEDLVPRWERAKRIAASEE